MAPRRRKLVFIGLLVALGVACSRPTQDRNTPQQAEGTPPPARVCRGVLVIDGIFDATGTTLLRLDPVHCYARHSGPAPNQTQGTYVVETTYADGNRAELFFDALVADDAGHTQHGFFEVVQPVDGAIAQIRITTSDRRRVFAHIAGAAVIMG